MQVKKLLAMSQELWAEIEELRFSRHFKTESDAMRYIMRCGVDAMNENPKLGWPTLVEIKRRKFKKRRAKTP